MSERLVVYLDTNFLSDLAKVSLGRLNEAAARQAEEALAFFTRLVESRIAIFPTCWVQESEIELQHDAELERAAHKIGARLSRGVRFQPPLEILSEQIERGFLADLDGIDYSPTWVEAFPHDPRGAIPKDVEEAAGHGRVIRSDEARAKSRELKRLFAEYHQERARQRCSLPLTYDQLKRENARTYLEIIALGPARRFLIGDRLDFADMSAAGAIGRAICVARERGDILGTSFWDFANSEAILKVPAIDIWASIETSMELDEPSRRWKGSDHYDLEALSHVLPYCDAVFCDLNIQEILRRRRIASQYGTSVYSLRDFQKFRQDVETCSGRHGAA